MEKIDVKLLPAEVDGISYRNDNAALIFLQHITSTLHEDLVNKLKESPVLGKYFCSNALIFIASVHSHYHRFYD